MKKIFKFSLILFIVIGLASCSKDEEVVVPEFDFTLSKTRVAVGEEVELNIIGSAETFSVFTGDAGHQYENSHLVVNDGKDVNYEDVWLPSSAIPGIMAHLQTAINDHNASTVTDQTRAIIDPENIKAGLEEIVNIRFSNSELLRVRIFDVLLELTGVKALSEEIVNLFSENDNLLLVPDDGYSTGFSIDRNEKIFKYTYSTPGTYTVTVVATNVSGKIHRGDGYNTDRTSRGDEYNYKRTIREMSIIVE